MSLATPKRFYGCLEPKHDARRLQIRDYLSSVLPPPPATSDRTGAIPTRGWGAMLNTSIGDCTIAGQGHEIQSSTAMAQKAIVTIPDSAVLTAYEAVSGYNPETGQNDNGAAIIDVLEYRRTVGIGGYKIRAHAAFPIASATRIRQAIYYFGGAMLGIRVPQSAEQQFDADEPWTVPWFSPIVGRHCIWVPAYDENWLYPVTWGACIPMSYDFYASYCDESYVLVDPLWFDSGTGFDPTGLNIDQLVADQSALAQAA